MSQEILVYQDKYGIYHAVPDEPGNAEKGQLSGIAIVTRFGGGQYAKAVGECGLGYPIIDGWYVIKDTDGIWISDGKTGGTGKRSIANASPATQRNIQAFFDGLEFVKVA